MCCQCTFALSCRHMGRNRHLSRRPRRCATRAPSTAAARPSRRSVAQRRRCPSGRAAAAQRLDVQRARSTPRRWPASAPSLNRQPEPSIHHLSLAKLVAGDAAGFLSLHHDATGPTSPGSQQCCGLLASPTLLAGNAAGSCAPLPAGRAGASRPADAGPPQPCGQEHSSITPSDTYALENFGCNLARSAFRPNQGWTCRPVRVHSGSPHPAPCRGRSCGPPRAAARTAPARPHHRPRRRRTPAAKAPRRTWPQSAPPAQCPAHALFLGLGFRVGTGGSLPTRMAPAVPQPMGAPPLLPKGR